jgi:hypothetical protein
MSLALTFWSGNSGQPSVDLPSVDGGIGSEWALWEIRFANLGDPRTWAVGEAALPDAKIDGHYIMPISSARTYCSTCSRIGDPANLHVVVEQAVGGPAGFPSLVTPDYLRVYRLEYVEAAPGDYAPRDIAHLSLRFTQSAGDFSARQEPCFICK